MNQIVLITELTKNFTELLRGYSLPNKAGLLQQVQVFAQYLPQPSGITFTDKAKTGLKNYVSSDYESNFPCVIVKLEDETDTEQRALVHSSVNVRVLVAIYDEGIECQGYKDILNLQEFIRLYLLESRVLAQKFILNMPLKSRLLEVETWPVYWGEMELVYTIGRPMISSEWVHALK